MITCEEAEACGLQVEVIDLRSARWNLIWELYVRSDHVMKASQTGALIETVSSSLSRGVIPYGSSVEKQD
jgi:hypothetical protein